HAVYYLSLAEEAEPNLYTADRGVWLERLAAEHDNLRAALAWSQTEPEGTEVGLRLAGALYWFWLFPRYCSQGRGWLEGVLARADGSGRATAWALYSAAGLAWRQGDYAAARPLSEKSIAILREVGDRCGLAWSLIDLGIIARAQGDYRAARSSSEEGVALLREVGDLWRLALALSCLGNVAHAQGDDD